MPFLRRRGNAPLESEARPPIMNRESVEDAAADASLSLPSTQPLQTSSSNMESASPWLESRASVASQRPEMTAAQEESNRQKRFSLLRFRNASDSQLSLRAKQQAEKPPPVPRPPEIITTAPTGELTGPKKKTSRLGLAAARLRRSQDLPRENSYSSSSGQPLKSSLRKQSTDERRRPSLSPLDEPVSPRISYSSATGHSNGTAGGLTALSNRPSESSRSDISPLSTPKKTPSNNPFFKLRRSKKPPEPLFPIAHLPRGDRTPGADSSTSLGVVPTPRPSSVHSAKVTRTLTDKSDVGKSAATLFGAPSAKSRQSSPTRPSFFRERSSTLSSMGRPSTDDHQTPAATRTSSSTGRKSFGDLLGMSRLRQNTDFSRQGSLTPATPGSNGSKDNSLQLAREPVVALPERRDDESAAKYLARVEEVISRGSIAAALCKEADAFYTSVLRSYMRSFSFFGEPMDMAIRKLLMEAELPKETQQIDRCLQAFANRYHECNPGIYASPDQAYFIAFSLLILHTDVFNKNNKYKMQKPDYIKNTHGEGIFDDILECFYDNISYTPFIHVEDEIDLQNERAGSTKTKKKPPLLAAASDPAKRAQKEPIDPYTLIIDGNLDALRPNLKEAMHLEEHYNYLGTSSHLNLKDLQKTFFRTGVLQIISARSRPDAFMSEKTATNPDDAHPGVVDIKVTKVGLLWRKDAKKRKTRSPWQEWGAILTGAQLYFFRNTSWIKNLMHQYETHIKGGHDGIPIIFKPPLEEFKPDALMSTQGAVALHDSEYKKHKNAFLYVRSGGLDEVLLADTEDEMNDWLAKLNYAAAFRTSGVRMRGVVGSNYDGQGRRGMRRLDSSEATQLVDTPTGQVSIARGRIDQKMAEDIQLARREFMLQKIQESDEKVQVTQKQLDEQLRNARHLQVLAPIQPRSREQLLTAAGRLAAQLKWTRMEIWREKCHRDILKMDLEEDLPELSPLTTPVKSHQSAAARERSSSPTPRAKNEVNSRLSVTSRKGHKFSDLQLDRAAGPAETEDGIDSPLDQKFETPPQSATINPGSTSEPASADVVADHIKSLSSFGPSDPALADLQRPQSGNDIDESRSARPPTRSTQDQDDVDAEERDFLRQAGLLEARSHKDGSDKATVSTIGEGGEFGDRNKIRRSLHRTLREGAGHLSHHRSRKGKESMSNFGSEEARQESKLSRGTGSFTVHGKKASVINFGTEIQSMTTDEKLRPRKLPPCAPTDRPASPSPSNGDDDDYYSAAGDLEEQTEPLDRRESVTSESTATARSFRELHRKYSTAQAARSASSGGRLAIPSDTESDALSFSDGRRSPLPPFDIDEAVEEDDGDDARKRAQQEQEQEHEDTVLPEKEDVSDDEGPSSPDRLASPPIQVVNA